MINIAIFASGTGSNARSIIRYFANHPKAIVSLVVSNRPNAGVLDIARENNIKTLIINRKMLEEGTGLVETLQDDQIGLVVLAGFLQKIPPILVAAYPGKIVNIHPALLPKFGGKGMYGMHVHEAVLAAGEKESGITIHFVDEQYDHGAPIFQARCPVLPGDKPADLAKRIQELEHKHFAPVLEQILQNRS